MSGRPSLAPVAGSRQDSWWCQRVIGPPVAGPVAPLGATYTTPASVGRPPRPFR